MFGLNPRLSPNETAEILETLEDNSSRTGRDLRQTAIALRPHASTAQTESHRAKVKGVMLREFTRPTTEVKGHTPAPASPALPLTSMVTDGIRVDMADLDGVDPATAAADAAAYLRIVNARVPRSTS